jgi:hypothetical protein
MSASEQASSDRWEQMQDAVSRARQRPVALVEAVAAAADLDEAADAIAALLDIDAGLAAELLNLHVSEFVGQSR